MQDAFNSIGTFAEDFRFIRQSISPWMYSVERLIRWLRVNSCRKHADYLEEIIAGLRGSLAVSSPMTYCRRQVTALNHVADRLVLLATEFWTSHSLAQRGQLYQLLGVASQSVGFARRHQIADWIEFKLEVPVNWNSERQAAAIRRIREEVRLIGEKHAIGKEYCQAIHSLFRESTAPGDAVAVAPCREGNFELPVIYYYGAQSYSLAGRCPVCVSSGAHYILQCFLTMKRAMTVGELGGKSENPSQVISRFMKAHDGMFRFAIRKPRARGEGFFARVQHVLPRGPD